MRSVLTRKQSVPKLKRADSSFSSITQRRVLEALRLIPSGKITTYAALARATGVNSSQAIGQLLKRNPFPDQYPCYKVVRSDGSLGGFYGTKRIDEKKKRLAHEGIVVKKNQILNFQEHLFQFETFRSDRREKNL